MTDQTETFSETDAALAEISSSARKLSKTLQSSLSGALQNVIVDGEKASDVLRRVGRKLADRALDTAVTGLFDVATQTVFGGFGASASEAGLGVRAFARGGAFGAVVNAPTAFPLNDRPGFGVLGEAGPEAVLPLTRGADGRLGVRAGGGASPVTVVVNTPDAASFRRSRAQIAAELSRVIDRARAAG